TGTRFPETPLTSEYAPVHIAACPGAVFDGNAGVTYSAWTPFSTILATFGSLPSPSNLSIIQSAPASHEIMTSLFAGAGTAAAPNPKRTAPKRRLLIRLLNAVAATRS